MDEDFESLIAALDRVADSDAKIRTLASRRRLERFKLDERFPVELCGSYGAESLRHARAVQDQGN
jgi:hypothetical protein